ncbi:lipopolysaccharide biosynthesis protein [Rhodopirellula halodulae]|uniref:lipopolysaccharide biosynthesis protein n=1 Tax=Rhodopirellula halodulae TaxID=2894198 RepID=UPI001E5140BF|nr:MATE family efflux transporter [Rhodopirellula sp. JC737]MCC9654434.1 hypothetical protein [Rhodopirellula sp. JC737]
MISQMAVFGLVEFETLLVGRYCTDVEVGTWGAIRRMISLVSAPLLLINAAVPTFIAELYSAGDLKQLQRLLRTTSTIATPPALIAFLLFLFFGDAVLSVFDPDFAVGATSLCLLGAANVVFVGAGSAGLTLRMTNRLGVTTVTTVLLAIAYVFTAPWVIQTYQLFGAACMAALMICARNVISMLIVRWQIKIWCTPTTDLRGMLELSKRILNRKKQAKT